MRHDRRKHRYEKIEHAGQEKKNLVQVQATRANVCLDCCKDLKKARKKKTLPKRTVAISDYGRISPKLPVLQPLEQVVAALYMPFGRLLKLKVLKCQIRMPLWFIALCDNFQSYPFTTSKIVGIDFSQK